MAELGNFASAAWVGGASEKRKHDAFFKLKLISRLLISKLISKDHNSAVVVKKPESIRYRLRYTLEDTRYRFT